jgi:hypothetical protein
VGMTASLKTAIPFRKEPPWGVDQGGSIRRKMGIGAFYSDLR